MAARKNDSLSLSAFSIASQMPPIASCAPSWTILLIGYVVASEVNPVQPRRELWRTKACKWAGRKAQLETCQVDFETDGMMRMVTTKMVASWSLPRRLWNNSIATLGPLL